MPRVCAKANNPIVFVFDVGTQHLAVYKASNRGLKLTGVRQITWDLKLEELNPALAGQGVSVSQVKKALEKQSRTRR